MRAARQRLLAVTRPRALLTLALLLGLMTSYLGESTAAERREGFYTAPSVFESGTVDITGLVAGSTASTLPSATAFKWDSSGAGADCASLLPLPDVTSQAMLPGHYCIAKITLRNTNPKALDAWLRIRLVRHTTADTTATEALNNRLRFFMHEYSGGTSRTAEQYQTSDCAVSSYKPVSSVTDTAPSTAIIAPVTSTTMGNRLPLDSVGQAGKNIGKHPGVSLPADSAVTAMAGTGFGLSAGTGLTAPPSGTNVVPSDWNMSTDSTNTATYNAVNLVGNDEVTNPRRKLDSNVANGTRPAGTLPEAELLAGRSRYYCAAIYFPSDTNLTAGNGAGDNAAAGGSMAYYLAVSAAQQFGRSVD